MGSHITIASYKNMKFTIIFTLFTFIITNGSAVPALSETFQKCDLASQLLSYGGVFNQNTIGDWICLTYYESSWTTSVKGGPNYDGSYDYGLFQINDGYWCYASSPAEAAENNDCNLNCSNLLDDNINDDEGCASLIYNRHGFQAWYGWVDNCQG